MNAEGISHSPGFTHKFKSVKPVKERKSRELAAVKVCIHLGGTPCRIYYRVTVIEREERVMSLRRDFGTECSKGLALKLSPGRAFPPEEVVSAKALRLRNVRDQQGGQCGWSGMRNREGGG